MRLIVRALLINSQIWINLLVVLLPKVKESCQPLNRINDRERIKEEIKVLKLYKIKSVCICYSYKLISDN